VAFDSFFFQTAEERLGNRIVPTVASAAHAGHELVVLAPTIEVITAKLKSTGQRLSKIIGFQQGGLNAVDAEDYLDTHALAMWRSFCWLQGRPPFN